MNSSPVHHRFITDSSTQVLIAPIMVRWDRGIGSRKGVSRVAYLEGQLRGGITAIGGEHTGFELTVEVDMSAIDGADTLADKTVALSGEVYLKNYTERGPVLIFEAKRATEKRARD
jgi:hypothetical protein